jgi:hypothetical protein
MNKGRKIVVAVLAIYTCICLLHLGLNVGFGKLRGSSAGTSSFRVGFLPVT